MSQSAAHVGRDAATRPALTPRLAYCRWLVAVGLVFAARANIIADVITADRDAASGERPRQANDALQTEQKMKNLMTRAAVDCWPSNLQSIRELQNEACSTV